MSKLFALHEHTLWVHGNGYESRIVGLVRDSMGISALGRLYLCHDAEADADGVTQLQSGFLGISQDVMLIYDDSRPVLSMQKEDPNPKLDSMALHGLTQQVSQTYLSLCQKFTNVTVW